MEKRMFCIDTINALLASEGKPVYEAKTGSGKPVKGVNEGADKIYETECLGCDATKYSFGVWKVSKCSILAKNEGLVVSEF